MAKNNNIAKRWRVLSGEKEWEGLLEPLDLDLRRYVIHYGERAQAIADAFIAETKSKNCGLSRYPAEGFFSHVGLDKGNPFKYEVTTFFYAAYGDLDGGGSDKVFKKSSPPLAETETSNCIGYVAVATDEGKVALGRRDVLVVWRGSMVSEDWTADFEFDLVSAKDILGTTNNPRVHKGWYSVYTATNTSKYNRTKYNSYLVLNTMIYMTLYVSTEVKKLMSKYQEEELSITVTGHSMGAALATLNAVDMAYNKVNVFSSNPNKTVPITAFVFASPRVGDRGFGSVFSDLNTGASLHLLRVNEFLDVVPQYPLIFQGYVDVGHLLLLMVLKSPYIKPFLHLVATRKWLPVHSLELHLHGVAGTQGVFGGFNLEIDRDLGLMNKGGDFVKDEYLKIVSWWTEKNKSMVQNDDGSWELKDSQDQYN
ncbi:phospholipase A1-II 4-like [Humulus lupulus]|uniref:phospholipase A1-II 4-like n=1 Tax=Humulus lupulus TaxID=3486 RepID=UPI002B41472D|nr:phospholipase A1-II 4-like [Humulus lupulus]